MSVFGVFRKDYSGSTSAEEEQQLNKGLLQLQTKASHSSHGSHNSNECD